MRTRNLSGHFFPQEVKEMITISGKDNHGLGKDEAFTLFRVLDHTIENLAVATQGHKLVSY